MYLGLPSGYVRFGTVAHQILRYMHECGGKAVFRDFLEVGIGTPASVSVTLQKLRECKFIHECDRVRDSDRRPQMVYSLEPFNGHKRFKPFTPIERYHRHHARKSRAPAMASIFTVGRRAMNIKIDGG